MYMRLDQFNRADCRFPQHFKQAEEILSSVIKVHNASIDREVQVQTAGLLVPGPTLLEGEAHIRVEKMEEHKTPGSDEISAELTKAGGEILLSAIWKLIKSP
jgi:hypothetical protein